MIEYAVLLWHSRREWKKEQVAEGSPMTTLTDTFQRKLLENRSEVKRRAQGALRHDYLVPSGPYHEQWDWDGFFIGMALAADIPSEAIYLKNWALNYLEHTNHRTGFCPGLLTPKGRDRRLHHVKPFLAQGVYFASRFLDDFAWARPWMDRLEAALQYREHHGWHKNYGLGSWTNSMESGADNNIALLPYPKWGVLAADFNALFYRELRAISLIFTKLGNASKARAYKQRALALRRAIQQHLWHTHDETFYNRIAQNGAWIKRHAYSNILPLWAGIAPRAAGRAMIKRHVLNPKRFWARWGVRTLATDDPSYNNANIIKPYSNWQGPVWPIVNVLSMQALLNYGCRKQAIALAKKITALCLNDIKKSGGMHENYHADTGKPLAAPNFVSWNLLVGGMMDQARSQTNPFLLPS